MAKFIDLFAGIGGFRLGMEKAGHECVGFCEIDEHAVRSYRAMHDTKGEWFSNDITTVKPGDMPDFEILTGGFPCQSFSIAGKRGGFEDTRGTLFFEIARIIQERQPQLVFLENVRGLLSHDEGQTFGTILNTFWELGYDAEWELLNSKDFGVPQNRERIFIIAYPRGRSGGQIFPVRGQDKMVNKSERYNVGTITTRTGQAESVGTYVVKGEQFPQVRQIGNILESKNWENPQAGRIYDTDGISPSLNTMQGGGREPKIILPVSSPDMLEKNQNGRRFKENGDPMFTLTTRDKHGVMIVDDIYNNREERIYKDYSPTLRADRQGLKVKSDGMRIRKLTPKECWRLQGFPDELFEKAREVNSDSQLYKQAGNSVTVNVIYEIAKRIKELMA